MAAASELAIAANDGSDSPQERAAAAASSIAATCGSAATSEGLAYAPPFLHVLAPAQGLRSSGGREREDSHV